MTNLSEILMIPVRASQNQTCWSLPAQLDLTIDVINVYNVYKQNLGKRVYYFANVYLNKNHMSETKQNYDSDEDN